ncbi:tRNA-dihydrouridine synthase B [Rhodanobacter lindaniclasticus]
MARIVKAVVDAVAVPVTLKIRTGWNRDNRNALTIARIAEDNGIAALAVHGRTRADKYEGEAEYATIVVVKAAVRIPVMANGDITTPQKARQVLDATGADAVMIGRGAQGRPWIFREVAHYLATGGCRPNRGRTRSPRSCSATSITGPSHGELAGVRIARKHLGWYAKDRPENVAFRQVVNRADTASEQRRLTRDYFAALAAGLPMAAWSASRPPTARALQAHACSNWRGRGQSGFPRHDMHAGSCVRLEDVAPVPVCPRSPMRKHLWPLCLLFTLALVPGATTRAAGQTIKVYPIAAGTAATGGAGDGTATREPAVAGRRRGGAAVRDRGSRPLPRPGDRTVGSRRRRPWLEVRLPAVRPRRPARCGTRQQGGRGGVITATAAGAQHTDFSHPILSTGLGVAVRGGQTAGWLAVARALESPASTVATALVLLLLVAGSLLWLLEYRRRPEPSAAVGGPSASGGRRPR